MDTLNFTSLKPENLTWITALRLFTLRCKSKNLAVGTLHLYRTRLESLRLWLESNGAPAPASVTANDLRGFLEARKAKGAGSLTVDCLFRILRTFWRFLHRDGLILTDPMEKVERPRIESRLIKPFTDEQLKMLLAVLDKDDPFDFRDYALVILLADTGLRLSEAFSLKLDDIEWALNSVVVLGKGRKERRIAFGQTTKRVLMTWIRRRGDIEHCDWLFFNRFGQQMTPTPFGHRLKQHTVRAGIATKRLSAHALRHYFAVSFLKHGGSLPILQRLLGHAALDQTQRYLNISESDILAQQQRQASPMDRLGPLPGERRQVRLR